jgi:phage terminase large subunit
MKLNGKIFKYFAEREKNNKFIFVLKGGRRSGKTFATCQKLLILCNNTAGTIVNIASMTAEQGRLGAYADFNTIIKDLARTKIYICAKNLQKQAIFFLFVL